MNTHKTKPNKTKRRNAERTAPVQRDDTSLVDDDDDAKQTIIIISDSDSADHGNGCTTGATMTDVAVVENPKTKKKVIRRNKGNINSEAMVQSTNINHKNLQSIPSSSTLHSSLHRLLVGAENESSPTGRRGETQRALIKYSANARRQTTGQLAMAKKHAASGTRPNDGSSGGDGGGGCLWTTKHAPMCREDIVVHKKKVDEMQQWLEYQESLLDKFAATNPRHTQQSAPQNTVDNESKLVIVTGPPGCGKSATLSFLARALGWRVMEWQPQSQLTWDEVQSYRHIAAKGSTRSDSLIDYQSKLDAFKSFVLRCTLPALHVVVSSGENTTVQQANVPHADGHHPITEKNTMRKATSFAIAQTNAQTSTQTNAQTNAQTNVVDDRDSPHRRCVVVIDDIPYVSTREQQHALTSSLLALAHTACAPVVLMVTESSEEIKENSRAIRNMREAGLGLVDTHVSSAGRGGNASFASGIGQRNLVEALQANGIPKIAFNPITALNIEKALGRILQKESITSETVPLEQVTAIAQQAGGDLRSAVLALQLVCSSRGIRQSTMNGNAMYAGMETGLPATKKRKTRAKNTSASKVAASSSFKGADKERFIAAVAVETEKVTFLLRDTCLSIFHGLGKLLYNKRNKSNPEGSIALRDKSNPEGGIALRDDDTDALQVYGKDNSAQCSNSGVHPLHLVPRQPAIDEQQRQHHHHYKLASWTQRAPMDGFDPEKVLDDAALDARKVIAFLHENIPSFIEDSSIHDIAHCMEELSAADTLARGSYGALVTSERSVESAASLAEAAAGSVAARGVCFWNTHPAPKQWRALHAPTLFAAQRGMLCNIKELERTVVAGQVVHSRGASGLLCKSELSTDVVPVLRRILTIVQQRGVMNHGSTRGGLVEGYLETLVEQLPARWMRFWQGGLHEEHLHSDVIGQRLRTPSGIEIGGDGVWMGGGIDGKGWNGDEEDDPIED